MKYKKGDKVTIRTFERMEKEYSLDGSWGYLTVPGGYDFTAGMEAYSGKTYTISDVNSNYYKLEGIGQYVFTDAMLDLVPKTLPKTTRKVGDMLTIRSWESMAKEFADMGSYLALSDDWRFPSSMKKFCGQTLKVKSVGDRCYTLEGGDGWYFTEEMVEDAKPVAIPNGTKVLIKTWDAMSRQYGTNLNGAINVPFDFTRSMEKHCGKVLTIKSSWLSSGKYCYQMSDADWNWSEQMFEKVGVASTVLSSVKKEIRLSDLKAGMKVRIKSYDALVAEYGKDEWGDVPRCPGGFSYSMKAYCGKVYTVKSVDWRAFSLKEFGVDSWSWSPQMLEEIVAEAEPVLKLTHVVTNNGQTYSSFGEKARAFGATKWVSGSLPPNGTKVALIKQSDDHCFISDGKTDWIIGQRGIKAIEEPFVSEKIDGASFDSILKSLEVEKEFVKKYSFIIDSSGSMRSESAIAPAVTKSKEENTFMGDVYASMTTTGGFDDMLEGLLEGLDDEA